MSTKNAPRTGKRKRVSRKKDEAYDWSADAGKEVNVTGKRGRPVGAKNKAKKKDDSKGEEGQPQQKKKKTANDGIKNIEALYDTVKQDGAHSYYPTGTRREKTGRSTIFPPLGKTIKGIETKWKPSEKNTNGDLLEWLLEVVAKNKERIREEFYFELDAMISLDRQVEIDGVSVNAGRFFNETQVRWVSFTLFGRTLEFWRDLGAQKKEVVDLALWHGNTGWGKASNFLVCLISLFFPWYMGNTLGSEVSLEKYTVNGVLSVVKTDLLEKWGRDKVRGILQKMINVLNEIFKVLYEGIGPGSARGLKVKNLDSTISQAMTKFLSKFGLKDELRGEVKFVMEEFAEVRKLEKDTKGTLGITEPTRIYEIDLRRFAADLAQRVFGDEKKWDKVKFVANDDSISDDKDTFDRVCSALLLLQLVVGSRFRGIFALNKIERYAGETKNTVFKRCEKTCDRLKEKTITTRSERESDNVFVGVQPSNVIVVSRLSKEKDIDEEVLRRISENGERDGFDGERKTIESERDNRVITKGLQYYFLDPIEVMPLLSGNDKKEKVIKEAVKKYTDTKNYSPSVIFFNLLSQVRQ